MSSARQHVALKPLLCFAALLMCGQHTVVSGVLAEGAVRHVAECSTPYCACRLHCSAVLCCAVLCGLTWHFAYAHVLPHTLLVLIATIRQHDSLPEAPQPQWTRESAQLQFRPTG